MWLYQGLPTIFGTPTCQPTGTCEMDNVVQWNPVTESWKNVGRLNTGRRLHEVVEVPATFCDPYVDQITSTMTPPTTTITPPTTERKSAALLIGGWTNDPEVPELEGPLDLIELFGCEYGPDETVALQPYPMQVFHSAATFVEDNDGGFVVVCGGFNCEVGSDPNSCSLTSSKYLLDCNFPLERQKMF